MSACFSRQGLCSRGCLELDQAGLELTEIHLSLCLPSAGSKEVLPPLCHHCLALIYCFERGEWGGDMAKKLRLFFIVFSPFHEPTKGDEMEEVQSQRLPELQCTHRCYHTKVSRCFPSEDILESHPGPSNTQQTTRDPTTLSHEIFPAALLNRYYLNTILYIKRLRPGGVMSFI